MTAHYFRIGIYSNSYTKISAIIGQLLKSFIRATCYLLLATYPLTIMISCGHANEWQEMENGNFDIVTKGRYPGKPKFLGPGLHYEVAVKKFCAEIEKNMDLLATMTRKFFLAPQELVYQFKFSTLDEEKNFLILRYFSRIADHPLYAGYQIQFVFDLATNRLVKIFISEVPLE